MPRNPWRILRVAADYPQAGSGSYGTQPSIFYLSVAQASLGHDVHIIATALQSPDLPVPGITVHRVQHPFNVNVLRALADVEKDSTETVVHTHATSGFALALANSAIRAPIVSHVHGTTRSKYIPAIFRFEDRAVRFSMSNMWYY